MKLKLFYGWYIVFIGMTLAAINGSIMGYGWTAFVGPISTTFGWTMTQVSLASSLRSLEFGVFNPIWGPVVDRGSPKWLMRIGAVTTSLGLVILSQTRNLWMYYGGFLIIGVGSSLVTGMLPLTIIARWFKKDIGKASGFFYMGNAIGGVTVPIVVWLIETLGWRNTVLSAAFVFLAIGIVASFIFKTRPEDYGLVPDGKDTSAGGKKSARSSDFGTSVKEALKSRAFWHIAVMTVFQTSTISTVMLYAIPYLTSLGMERTTAGTVVMVYTLISVSGRVPFGMLSDVFRKSYVLSLCTLLMIAGLSLYWGITVRSPWWFIMLFAIPYGLGVSGVTAIRSPILVEYFGTKNFGSIFGLTSIFFAIGSLFAPPIAGRIYDTYQDYKIWWLSLMVFGIVGFLSILTIPRARKPDEMKESEAVKQS